MTEETAVCRGCGRKLIGKRGEWYEMLPGMADASGVCDATGLGAPRVCICFKEALAKDAEAARSGRKTGQ